MASLADLLTTKTLDNWKQTLVNGAAAVQLKTENWAEGGYTRTLVALFAQLHKGAGDVVRIFAASGFLDTAEGAWLTLLTHNLFRVDRIEAAYAAAPNALLLTNSGGGLFEFEPGDIIVAHTTTKATYKNTTGGTLAPGAGQTLIVDLVAEEPGSSSGAGVGTITTMVTTFLGVSCTNIVALVGLDEEKDAALRTRARNSLALLALGGIKRAYEFIATSAKRADGSAVGITRVQVLPAFGNGTVTVTVAGPSGAVSGPDVAVVQAAFDTTVTPYGFDATATSATNIAISAPCTVWIPASLGLTEAVARTLVFDALKAYVESLPIGGVVITPTTGRVYWRALLGVVASAIPGTLKAQLTSEVDTAVADGVVPAWTGVLADTTVIQVVV